MQHTKTLNFRLPPDVAQRLKIRLAEKGTTLQNISERMVRKFIGEKKGSGK